MSSAQKFPNEEVASVVVSGMINEKVISVQRMTTGEQYFVYAVKSQNADYVIRMTEAEFKKNFLAGIHWQKKLLPLGVPLAEFIQTDLDGNYSPFPALLMRRLPGNDLINVYETLSTADKKNLANEIVKIQADAMQLPEGKSFGILSSYDERSEFNTWFDFIRQRFAKFINDVIQNRSFNDINVKEALAVLENLKSTFTNVHPKPFLWDASERNVIVHNAKISGIVDVDDMCFGDPLFVIGITYVALAVEGHDTLYADYWAEALGLDKTAQLRLVIYRLFYIILFMSKHQTIAFNGQKVIFNADRLKTMYQQVMTNLKSP